MSITAPIYTPENTHPAYQLNWAVCLFWKSESIASDLWWQPLQAATEQDGVRLLEQRQPQPNISQFLASSQPHVAPSQIIRSIKGRLQYLVRERNPKAFQRNYSIMSVGHGTSDCMQRYIAGQGDHHPLADPRVKQRFERYQYSNSDVDLGQMRLGNYGPFCHSLHVVIEYDREYREFDDDMLVRLRGRIINASTKNGWLLARIGVVANHIHLAIGCGMTDSPERVALSFMNNVAYLYGMEPILRHSYYAGTIGRYDLGAIWNHQNL